MDLKNLEKCSGDIILQNTLTREKEIFKPIKDKKVGMYNCGPTVYGAPHIGNLRSYVFADMLRKMFEYNGFEVTQVINITDVGHLVSDEDDGDDKVEKAAKRAGKTAEEITSFYTEVFFSDLKSLNIDTKNTIFPKATEHINEQIDFIKTLEEKEYTYKTSDGIYFDTSKFSSYGTLAMLDIKGLKEGARVKKINEKKNITDFALWKFSPENSNTEEKRQQEWESPWGIGFPGWHIECSAMSEKYLGEQFDIHTGGIDHVPVHHTNEIAQSESVTGKQHVNYWMHNNFVNVDGEKMSKSLGNIITLKDIRNKGFSPIAYRYWLLTANYDTLVNFTYEALDGANTAFSKLQKYITEYSKDDNGVVEKGYKEKFCKYINDDINTSRVIALIWELVKDNNVSDKNKKATILDFDKILRLGLADTQAKQEEIIPEKVQELAERRAQARATSNWQESDSLRNEINKLGYEIKDTDEGAEISPTHLE